MNSKQLEKHMLGMHNVSEGSSAFCFKPLLDALMKQNC